MTEANQPSAPVLLSVIVPVFNEAAVLTELFRRLVPCVAALTDDYEIVLVDDGSHDKSASLIEAQASVNSRIRLIGLTRNFGHQAALQAGLDESRGQCVALLDADLQDPPELLAEFLARWREGYDVVYGVRKSRKENALKRAAYGIFYRSMRLVANVDIPLDSGDFCLMDRSVVEALNRLPERNRFLRGLRSWIGFKQLGVEYERQARFAGESKYSLRRLFNLALSGYIGFSALPLRLSVWFGLFASVGGFLLMLWAVVVRLTDSPAPWGWASTLAVIAFIGGIQLVLLGVVGEYISRIYDEVRGRPLYVVRPRQARAEPLGARGNYGGSAQSDSSGPHNSPQ